MGGGGVPVKYKTETKRKGTKRNIKRNLTKHNETIRNIVKSKVYMLYLMIFSNLKDFSDLIKTFLCSFNLLKYFVSFYGTTVYEIS